ARGSLASSGGGIPQDFGFFAAFDLPELLSATAWRTSALKADSLISSPSWRSIARRTFPSRLELKRRAGSLRDAPFAKVSFTTLLYDSPVQMMPSCDQIGVPIHFHSSTTSGSASLMSLRILPRVSPRQSPSLAIRFEMSADADCPDMPPTLLRVLLAEDLRDEGGLVLALDLHGHLGGHAHAAGDVLHVLDALAQADASAGRYRTDEAHLVGAIVHTAAALLHPRERGGQARHQRE